MVQIFSLFSSVLKIGCNCAILGTAVVLILMGTMKCPSLTVSHKAARAEAEWLARGAGHTFPEGAQRGKIQKLLL